MSAGLEVRWFASWLVATVKTIVALHFDKDVHTTKLELIELRCVASGEQNELSNLIRKVPSNLT